MLNPQPGMRAGGEDPADIGVAIVTNPVTNVSGTLDLRRGHNRARGRGAGTDQACNPTRNRY